MSSAPPPELRYKRSRFTARLPTDRLYSPSHFYVKHQEGDLYRVGFTRFAKRMLGEIVECDVELEVGSPVELGQVVGWVEAFKAVSDLYSVGEGTFAGGNPALARKPQLIDEDPHGDGWLYAFNGKPDPACVDAEGYTKILDGQIDKMLGDPPTSDSKEGAA
ncbi:MAG: glycine cleavage system protein H [Phycisphaeraceae bacterium]